MALLLAHPAHAALDCKDCQRWLYDIETCQPKERGGKVQPRPAGVPTPCQSCPKKSPQHWAKIRPTRRTMATLDLYRRNRATFGRALTEWEAADGLLQRNFALLDAVFRNVEAGSIQRVMRDLALAVRR